MCVYEAFRFFDKKTAQDVDENVFSIFLVVRFSAVFLPRNPSVYTYLSLWKPAHARNDFDACAEASTAYVG